jgi:hypothetical protein
MEQSKIVTKYLAVNAEEYAALQARCDRYEKALNAIIGRNMPVPNKADMIKVVRETLGLDEGVKVANEALSAGKGDKEDRCTMCKEKPKGEGMVVCDECYNAFDGDRRGFWTSDNYQ